MLTQAQKTILIESESIHDDLQNLLKTLAEPDYQKFTSALLPGTTNLLGVRLPHQRQIARELAKGDWVYYLSKPTDTYSEETMLQGMVIGLISKTSSWGQTYSYLKAFIPRITNWSVCDSFCASLSFVKSRREEAWPFLMDCMSSNQEFEFRFGAVMLLNHYITDDWIDPVLEAYFTHHPKDYYAKMAIAWGISQAFAFDPRKTLTKIEQWGAIGTAAIGTAADPDASDRAVFIRQKTLQKILESNKVSPEYKNIIRAMKEGKKRGKNQKS